MVNFSWRVSDLLLHSGGTGPIGPCRAEELTAAAGAASRGCETFWASCTDGASGNADVRTSADDGSLICCASTGTLKRDSTTTIFVTKEPNFNPEPSAIDLPTRPHQTVVFVRLWLPVDVIVSQLDSTGSFV